MFSNQQIKGLITNQPTSSYNLTDRLIRAKTGLDLVERVLEAQQVEFEFGLAQALDNVPSLTVPLLYAQMKNDVYTFNQKTGQNDIQLIMNAPPTEHSIVWIGPDQESPFDTGQRFDGYQYFNTHPDAFLEFLSKQKR